MSHFTISHFSYFHFVYFLFFFPFVLMHLCLRYRWLCRMNSSTSFLNSELPTFRIGSRNSYFLKMRAKSTNLSKREPKILLRPCFFIRTGRIRVISTSFARNVSFFSITYIIHYVYISYVRNTCIFFIIPF